MVDQQNKPDLKSFRQRISEMGSWVQNPIIGISVGFVTSVAMGLTELTSSIDAAIYVAGVVGYTGLVFAYAWIDKRMYFLSGEDTRSRTMMGLIHLCIVGALAGVLRLIMKFHPSIVPHGKQGFSWPFVLILGVVILVMSLEISWLASGKWSRTRSRAASPQ